MGFHSFQSTTVPLNQIRSDARPEPFDSHQASRALDPHKSWFESNNFNQPSEFPYLDYLTQTDCITKKGLNNAGLTSYSICLFPLELSGRISHIAQKMVSYPMILKIIFKFLITYVKI